MKKEKILLGIRRYLGALKASVKHLLVYPIFCPKKANRFCFGVQALDDELGYDCQLIRTQPLDVIFPGIENAPISIGQVFPWEGSSISAYESLAIGAIISHLKPKKVFEIGTSVGVTAYNLAANLPENGELHTLDLPPAVGGDRNIETKFEVTVSDKKMIYGDRVDRRFLDTDVGARITQLYGDSAAFDYSDREGSYDVVFVDGSHAYAYVESDSHNAFKLVKPGGWVIWHDYNDGFFWPEVRKYLKTISSEREIFRIKGTMFAVAQA